jgi:hypothetical protein
MKHTAMLGLLALVTLGVGPVSDRADAQTPPTRRELMRTKLDASRKILEGLSLEDYALIADGAKSLRALSRASIWEVPTIPNAEQYIVYTGEFQRLTDELSRAARDRNLDGATLVYFRLTTSCVNCHKYVRSVAR